METGPVTARATHGAVDSAALARVAELETQLAGERAESSRRLKEAEPRVRQLREALHSMQTKLKHAAEEQILLEARLAGEVDETERLTHRVAELEEQIVRGTAPAGASPASSSGGGHPDVIGLRIDGDPKETPLGRRYEAHDTDSRRDVEILVFSHELSKLDGSRLDSLLQSRHPNLAAAIAFGRTRARPYVVFERAAGETLEEWVRRAGPAPETDALRVALQIARGLREAAFHGALHGDLSPRVVRITSSGEVKVEDAGLGGLHAASSRPLPSPGYAAPERLRDGAPPDARADVFSLGAVLHFVLTAHAPFEADAPRPAGPGPDPRKRRPAISPGLAQLVMTMTSSETSARPATWDDALAAIERLAAGALVPPPRAAEPRAVATFVTAHPFVAAALAAVPIVAAALLLRFGPEIGPSARERFDAAVHEADGLAAKGDTVGAAFTLGRFVRNTGDPAVEREAAARLQKLRLR